MKEIIFVVEEAPEGGYMARALGQDIFTEGDTIPQLKEMINKAVNCHFDKDDLPKMIHLRYIKEETLSVNS
ncbi:2-oxoisovalerate dehydrogenase [Bacteroidota bacterium]